jgi:hypothetical protein
VLNVALVDVVDVPVLAVADVVVVVFSVQDGGVPSRIKAPITGHSYVAGSPSYRKAQLIIQFSPGKVLPQSLVSNASLKSGKTQLPARGVVVLVVVVVVVVIVNDCVVCVGVADVTVEDVVNVDDVSVSVPVPVLLVLVLV